MPPALWRFLTSGFLGLTVAFWLWPSANPRHMLAVVFPACLLAASVGVAFWQTAQTRFHQLACRSLALAPLLVSAAIGILAWRVTSLDASQKTLAAIVAAACALVAIALWRLSRRQDGPDTAAGVLAGLAILILCARGAATVTFYPYQAPRDATRQSRLELQRLVTLAPRQPLYTTRTFPGKGDDYYNVFFYLAPALRGFMQWNQLPIDLPATVIMTPEEIPEARQSGCQVTELGRVAVKIGKPPLLVAIVWRANAATTRN